MVYDSFVLIGEGFSGTSVLSIAAAQQSGLTQGLVVLVILVVIAVALILVCGFMGRRADEEAPATLGEDKIGPAVTEATSPADSAAESVVSGAEIAEEIEEVGVVSEETLPQPETEAESAVSGVEIEEEAGEVEVVSEETLPQPETEIEPAAPVTEEVEEIAEEAQAAVAVSPAPPQPDDLKRIEGIGPKVSSLLNDAGIFTFAQLADTDVSRLKSIVDEAGLTMMNPASWPSQARVAASGDSDALASLQDELKGGRHT
jgi:predicted flap endonuclease-1-like 5' DNA nuclease